MGIALESRNLEQLKAATQGAPDTVKTLTYALRVSQQLLISRKFREEVCIYELTRFWRPVCNSWEQTSAAALSCQLALKRYLL